MFRILTLNKIAKAGLEKLDPEKYVYADDFEAPDGVLVRSASMKEKELPENVVAIARAGAGVNNIPLDVCGEKGVAVFNTPGANANAVKELTLCALFMTSRKIGEAVEWCKTLKGEGDKVGKLVEKGKSAFAGPEISGKKLGVVGLGAIGSKVARDAGLLGMSVIGYDPKKSAGDFDFPTTDSLDELLAESDYITLHLPLNEATKKTINSETLAKMKDGVRILNFSRGELVDSAALVSALKSGKAAAYATDFPTDETIGLNGVTAFPHLGASTPESEENCAAAAVAELTDYLEKGVVRNSVNLPDADLTEEFQARTCFIHKEDASFAERAVAAAREKGASVTNAFSASKNGLGYTVVDSDVPFDASAVAGTLRVRTL